MLAPDLTQRILARLGFPEPPAADRAGLDAIYSAWCRRVPFDNVVKRIHLATGSPAPFPNAEPEAFFELWLRDGTGGTCWPSSGGLHALLVTLGFNARRGSAAMFDDGFGSVHNHGTAIVRIDGVDYWADSSMLTNRVFPMLPGRATGLDEPLHAVRVEPVDDRWRVWWTHPFDDNPFRCLLLDDDVSAGHYLARYEASREASPFNTALYATRNGQSSCISAAVGKRWERRASGITSTPFGGARDRVLLDEFGYSEDVVARLPPDE